MENLEKPKRSRFIAAILAFLFGGIGINNLYTGRWGLFALDILFCWTYVPALLNLIRLVLYLWCDSDEEFIDKHCSL